MFIPIIRYVFKPILTSQRIKQQMRHPSPHLSTSISRIPSQPTYKFSTMDQPLTVRSFNLSNSFKSNIRSSLESMKSPIQEHR